jgi:hypothetical protein
MRTLIEVPTKRGLSLKFHEECFQCQALESHYTLDDFFLVLLQGVKSKSSLFYAIPYDVVGLLCLALSPFPPPPRPTVTTCHRKLTRNNYYLWTNRVVCSFHVKENIEMSMNRGSSRASF